MMGENVTFGKLPGAYGMNGTDAATAVNDSVKVPCVNITGNVSQLKCMDPASGTLPREITFDNDNLVSVIAYSCLFLVAACGNLTVFITLFRNRNIKSRVNLFIMHLSIADLIVTFVMLPLETTWNITVAWKAGEAACRILMFFRAFGLYLSSFTLVTISLDRYFAIMRPLSLNDADKRGKIMLVLAWIFSFVASIPQSVIFHVEKHPVYPWFTQCVTFNFFPTPIHELAYNLFHVIAVYGMPLLIITVSYSLILCEISKKSRQSKDELQDTSSRAKIGLRRSAMGNIERARIRTLKMTLVIVGVFAMCWTPYFVISAWWWFDKESARKVDHTIHKGFFLFAVSNSCMDPIVYGMFTTAFRRESKKWHRWFKQRLNGNPFSSKSATGQQYMYSCSF
ncbi:adipokinetic hormone/corazonin-related peptide receptor variant I-like isoform X2 [Haliotis cracherodii]|uniref:adipokinetic hormone/corazonin-related peptide receptor variant I-like isoform X2 n=1 Tax=Haliotis cracherodii TaxID=6455 RepID=UPI0039EAB10B